MPYKPMLKPIGGAIAQAGSTIGQTIAGIPDALNKKKDREHVEEQRKKAAEAIKADADLASVNWKTWNETYKNQAQPLIKAGIMTEQELESDLKMFPMPRRTDLLSVESIGKYLDRFSEQTANMLKKLETRRGKLLEQNKKKELGEEIQEAKRDKTMGKFGEAQDIQGEQPVPIKGPGGETQFTETNITRESGKERIPGAKTQEEIADEMSAGTTMGQLKEQPGFVTAPTSADLEKQKRLTQKESRLQEMNDYQEAMMNYRWASLNYKKTKDERTLQQAEDRGKQAINKLVSSIENKQIAEIDNQIKELKNPEPDILGDTPQIDYDAIAELETKKKNLQDQIDMLNAEKKMFGTVKGEKRTFSPGTGRETSRTTVPSPSEKPQLPGGTGGWKQVGNYKVRQK